MSCTKIFVRGRVTYRTFRIFERDKPYKLILFYRDVVPRPVCLGFASGLQLINDTSTSISCKTYNLPTKSSCNDMLKSIHDGYCPKCRNYITNCEFESRV